jgi:Rieske Fe-S protein
VFLDPLRRKSRKGEFVPVAVLDDVPADGVPRAFQVRADQTDAWNFYPQEPLGAVYLRRTSEGAPPEAVTATCPHLGCFVDFQTSEGRYQCPCHDSAFEPDGKRINPEKCPAARDLDSLEVKVEAGQEGQVVWVKFEKFKPGIAKKVVEE